MKYTLTIIALLCLPVFVFADYSVKGEGNFSCPEYVSAKRSNSTKFYGSVSWVQGYLTGVNYQRSQDSASGSFIGRDFPATSIARWLENHCGENPADDLADAARALLTELD